MAAPVVGAATAAGKDCALLRVCHCQCQQRRQRQLGLLPVVVPPPMPCADVTRRPADQHARAPAPALPHPAAAGGPCSCWLGGCQPLPPPSIAMHAHHSPLTSRGAMVSRTGKTLLRAPAAAGSSARTHLGMIDSDTNRAARGLFHRGIVSATI